MEVEVDKDKQQKLEKRKQELEKYESLKQAGLEKTKEIQQALVCNDYGRYIELRNRICTRGIPNWELLFTTGETTQISTLKRHIGDSSVAKLIYILINGLNNSFNVARPMTGEQMTELSIEITSELWDYRFEEIIAFIEGVKNSRYGQIYERLDPVIFWERFDKYKAEREQYLISRQTQYRESSVKVETEGDQIARKLVSSFSAIQSVQDSFKK